MNIAGIVVAFDSNRNPLLCLDTILPLINRLIIVDNSIAPHPNLQNRDFPETVSILRNSNVGGLAGAYNCAIDYISGKCKETTHILFLDDDTDTTSAAAFLQSSLTYKWANDPGIAAISPAYVDRATGLKGSHIQLFRWRYRFLPRDLSSPKWVSFLINSMSLWRYEAIVKIGLYSTELAVDHIDTDYCLRASLLNYKLILNPNIEFAHSIGNRRSFKFLGRTMQAGGHDSSRRFMIARNTVLISKKYALDYPAFFFLCISRLIYEFVGIVLAEDKRSQKLLALAKGMISGLFSRYGN